MNLLDEQRKADLADAAAAVLARMSYLTAERVNAAPGAPERPMVVTVSHAGSESTRPGRLHLAAGQGLAAAVAAGALGRTPTAAEVADAPRELAAILTSRTVRGLTRSPTETFAQTLPRVERLTGDAWAEAAGRDTAAVLDVEGEPLILWTTLRGKGFAGRGSAA